MITIESKPHEENYYLLLVTKPTLEHHRYRYEPYRYTGQQVYEEAVRQADYGRNNVTILFPRDIKLETPAPESEKYWKRYYN